jgi:hypothetical protein
MELCQMGCIRRLVPEDSVNREHFRRFEPSGLVGEVVEHLSRDGSRVRSEEKSLRFGEREGGSVTDRTRTAELMHGGDARVVIRRGRASGRRVCDGIPMRWIGSDDDPRNVPERMERELKRTLDVEGILHLSRRMLLRDEHRIEVPES